MSTYRKEWPCCDSVTETDAWEPERCPFCTGAPAGKASADLSRLNAMNAELQFALQRLSDQCTNLRLNGWMATDAERNALDVLRRAKEAA